MTVAPADVATALGRSTPASDEADYQRFVRWIADARMILRVGDGEHPGLGDLDLLDQEVVDYVVREAVLAHAQRPDNATTVEIAIDDGRTSRTYQSGAGRVVILAAWWAMLQPGGRTAGAFSTRPGFQPDTPL